MIKLRLVYLQFNSILNMKTQKQAKSFFLISFFSLTVFFFLSIFGFSNQFSGLERFDRVLNTSLTTCA